MRKRALGVPVAVVAVMLALPAPALAAASPPPPTEPTAQAATVDLTAYRVRIGDHPAYVRAVVDFTDGEMASNDAEAADANPFDGSARVDVRHVRVQAQAPPASGYGVTVRVVQGENRISVRISAPDKRFKYLAYAQLRRPERLAIDLYKSRPPTPRAQTAQSSDGRLALRSWVVRPGSVRAGGTARELFESTFQLVVRRADGDPVGMRPVTASESGAWRATVRYTIQRPQLGTLEAVDLSARDGALTHLAQVRVTLRP